MNVFTRYTKAVAITPSDTVDFVAAGRGASAQALLCDAIYVGVAGNVVVALQDGTLLTIAAVAGGVIPIAARRVNATSTTATGLFALYAI